MVGLVLVSDLAAQQADQQINRPRRFTPPVHARPLRGQPTNPPLRDHRETRRYAVRQVSGTQDFAAGTGAGDAPPAFRQSGQPDDQWRTRGNARPPADQLRSVIQNHRSGMPRLHHPSPQGNLSQPYPTNPTGQTGQTGQTGNSRRLPEIANPDPSLPAGSPFPDQVPAMSGAESAWPQSGYPEPYSRLDSGQPDPQSVLIHESATDDADNSLRNLQVEPRRLRERPLQRQQAIPSRYRSRPGNGRYSQEPDDSQFEGRVLKSCEEYREELLNTPITDIVVDIAPGRPSVAAQGELPEGLTRTWTDCLGTPLGTGTLTRLERSYIVVTDETGNSRRIPISRLGDGDLAIVTQFWVLPTECSLGCYPFEGRQWACQTMFWKASSLCHKPLYFENIQLERYGHSHGPIMEPLHSTAHFFTSLVLWPYNTGIHPPNECLYALGFYRPGDCAPWLKDPFPFSMHGALRQGAVAGAAVGILP